MIYTLVWITRPLNYNPRGYLAFISMLRSRKTAVCLYPEEPRQTPTTGQGGRFDTCCQFRACYPRALGVHFSAFPLTFLSFPAGLTRHRTLAVKKEHSIAAIISSLVWTPCTTRDKHDLINARSTPNDANFYRLP